MLADDDSKGIFLSVFVTRCGYCRRWSKKLTATHRALWNAILLCSASASDASRCFASLTTAALFFAFSVEARCVLRLHLSKHSKEQNQSPSGSVAKQNIRHMTMAPWTKGQRGSHGTMRAPEAYIRHSTSGG